MKVGKYFLTNTKGKMRKLSKSNHISGSGWRSINAKNKEMFETESCSGHV